MVVTSLVWEAAPQRASAAPTRQTGELLNNPGFEADDNYEYPRIVTEEGGGAVAEGWHAWWFNDEGSTYSVPEFEVAPVIRDPFRVHSGNAAQQIFRPTVLWMAGVYQTASVPNNASLHFTAWGHTWATFCVHKKNSDGSEYDDCHPQDSNYGNANPTVMKIGIDPTGGTDWSSSDVVWSPDYNIHDVYTQIAVDARAKGSTVTVFLFTTFMFPATVNNVYWDDASLTVAGSVAPQSTLPTTPSKPGTPSVKTPTSVSRSGKLPTQPPNADGSQHHIVKVGDTLTAIAYAYGVHTGDLMTLNGLWNDYIYPGQDLLIKEATVPTPTPTLDASPTPVETPTLAPTVTPEQVSEVPQATAGKICFSMFDDTNKNGQQDAGEVLVSGGQIYLNGTGSNAYTTDGTHEPFCFTDLAVGDYIITVQAPAGYTLNGAGDTPVQITGGSEVTLTFPAQAGQQGLTSFNSMFVIGAGVAALIVVLSAVVAIILLARRRKRTAT